MPETISSLRDAIASAPEAGAVAQKILAYVVKRIEDDPASAETLAAELKANAATIMEAASPPPKAAEQPPAAPSVQRHSGIQAGSSSHSGRPVPKHDPEQEDKHKPQNKSGYSPRKK